MKDVVLAAALRFARQTGMAMLAEGIEKGEDRSAWTIEVADKSSGTVLRMTLGECAQLAEMPATSLRAGTKGAGEFAT